MIKVDYSYKEINKKIKILNIIQLITGICIVILSTSSTLLKINNETFFVKDLIIYIVYLFLGTFQIINFIEILSCMNKYKKENQK